MFLTRMAKRFIPDKYFSYEYLSRYIPEKYRHDVDAVVRQFTDKASVKENEEIKSAPRKEESSSALDDINSDEIEKRRQNLVRNFSNEDDGQFPKGYTDRSREQSRLDSQGEGDFTSNPVNSPAGAGENINSNMGQRNFER